MHASFFHFATPSCLFLFFLAFFLSCFLPFFSFSLSFFLNNFFSDLFFSNSSIFIQFISLFFFFLLLPCSFFHPLFLHQFYSLLQSFRFFLGFPTFLYFFPCFLKRVKNPLSIHPSTKLVMTSSCHPLPTSSASLLSPTPNFHLPVLIPDLSQSSFF